jgi:ATP-dependent Clp protease ATP-binding subunit ClpB
VQREIGDRLARKLLAGDVADGDRVVVDRSQSEGEGLELTVQR